MICPTCRKPIFNALTSNATTNIPMTAYCRCMTLNIRLTVIDHMSVALKALAQALEPLKPAVPKAFYDAFAGEELEP